MAEVERGALFDEFVQSGLLDDADVTIQSARFDKWDYRGKSPNPVLALKLELKDADAKLHEEFLSAGDLKFFVPSNDQKKAVPVAAQQKLNINTNAVAFLVSLINADTRGELAKKIRSTDDISVLDGTRVHIVRKAQKERPGIASAPVVEGQAARQSTQMVVDKLLAYPWETGTATAASAPAMSTAAAVAAGNGVVDSAASVLIQIVSEAGGSIKKNALAGKVFTNADMKAASAAERNAVLGVIVTDGFLESAAVAGMGIKYDKAAGTVSMG